LTADDINLEDIINEPFDLQTKLKRKCKIKWYDENGDEIVKENQCDLIL